MLIENEKVNRDKYYFVGYSPVLNKYILACVVTWVGWYHRYYEISEEEYLSFGSSELDSLAENLYKQGFHSERFLFSEKKEENIKSNWICGGTYVITKNVDWHANWN